MIRMNEEAKDGQRMEEARMVKDEKDLKGLQTNIKKIGLSTKYAKSLRVKAVLNHN